MLRRLMIGIRVTAWGLCWLYPLLLYWALTRHGVLGGAVVGMVSAGLWFVRAASVRAGLDRMSLWGPPGFVMILSALSLLTRDSRVLLALPVVINFVLLVVFGGSLWSQQSYVERMARLWEPELTAEKVQHCRQFTFVWCGFFVVNGAITAAWAVAGAVFAWTLYTSVISYVLIGLLFLLEWVVRRWRFGGTRELEP